MPNNALLENAPMTFGETFVPDIMLSMSSDTLGSSASKEWVDYGPSRSSTPDSSASSRLAAQLERSAYRRSRTRRRQNSNNNNIDTCTRKTSRNKRNRSQPSQRNQSHAVQDDPTTKLQNGSSLDTSQRMRRKLADDDQQLIAESNCGMTRSRLKNGEHKEHRLNEDNTIVTAYPVSTYSVSCVTVQEDNHKQHYKKEGFLQQNNNATNNKDVQSRPAQLQGGVKTSAYNTEQRSHNGTSSDKHNGRTSTSDTHATNNKDVQSRPAQLQGGVKTGAYNTEQRSHNGTSSDKHNGRISTSDTHFEKRPRNPTVSKVRFEESWEDAPKKPASAREDRSPNKLKLGSNSDKMNIENSSSENKDCTTKVYNPNRAQNEEKRTIVNDAPEQNGHGKTNGKMQENTTAVWKNNVLPKREVVEVSRGEEPTPLKLRQLIKIHEVQIAEVAKSAALMKKPTGKFQEGRLVKVKAVHEIENNQAHVKRRAAKVPVQLPVPKNNNGFESSIASSVAQTVQTTAPTIEASHNQPCSDVEPTSPSNHDQESQKSQRISFNGDEMSRTQPRRPTVEMRRRKSPIVEDEKWKRHTAIGLVSYDHVEDSPRDINNGWLPKRKDSEPLTNDSDVDSEYMKKQQVEPEMQFLDEYPQGFRNVVDGTTSRVNEPEKSPAFHYEFHDSKENRSEDDVPPERPPLPEHFYSSNEEIQQARPPPPPVLDVGDTIEKAPLKNEIIKPVAISQATQCDATLSRSVPAVHISTSAIIEVHNKEGELVKTENISEERDAVLGNSRSTREMYEERLARINLVPLDKPNGVRRNVEIVSSPCTSLESFNLQNNDLDKNAYLEKLKVSLKQVKVITKEKDDLEKKFELELRDWKRKYEEQHKVANAYQKLEDRYRRRVEELQGALSLCTCSSDGRSILPLGQSGKRTEPYFYSTQTQSILDETEEWLKEQSIQSENIPNTENFSNNTRGQSGNSFHGSLSDLTGGADWAINYKDIDVTTDIDQYNGTSV